MEIHEGGTVAASRHQTGQKRKDDSETKANLCLHLMTGFEVSEYNFAGEKDTQSKRQAEKPKNVSFALNDQEK
jgi:hypothetical protein